MNVVLPLSRTRTVVAAYGAPAVAGAAALVAFGGDTLSALIAGAAFLASALAARRVHLLRRDLDGVAHFAGMASGDRGAAAADGLTREGRAAIIAVARLHGALRRDGDRVQAQLLANDAIIDALHDPLVLVDSARQVARANQAARGLFGDRMIGRDLAASVRHPGVLEAADAVLAGAASRSVEYSLPVPVERMFEVRVKPFRPRSPATVEAAPGGGDPVALVILTMHDITAIRRSEQMRADFIANASHELRTPLSTLLGFIETLRGPAHDDPEARDRFLSIMHEQASRMSRLVSDLLSLSRIELDEHMPPAGRVDVVRNLKGVLAALELKAAARRLRLTLSAPPVLPAVAGDEDQLSQVFQNLVSNAIKYSREQTEVTVAVMVSDGHAVGAVSGAPSGRRTPRPGNQMVAVAVTDRGEGIARTHLPRLTERFYRVDAARSRALGGTGLGLAIVKHIMNRHRGRLTIESEVGTGSTFTVYLPVAEPAAEAGDETRRAGPSAA